MTKLKFFLIIVVLTVSGCATVDLQPQDPQPQKHAYHYYEKGTAYYDKGAYDAAIEQFKMAIKVENDPADNCWIGHSYLWLALIYHAKGQAKDAVSYFQKVIARGDSNTNTFSLLAQCYYKLNQYDDAIKAGIRAIELDFSNNYAHFDLACAFFKTKQHKNANKAYKKAIELDPENFTYYNEWGVLLFNSGDYAGAVEQFKKAVSLQPDNWVCLLNLANAYYKQGRYDDAMIFINKAIELQTFSGIGAGFAIESNYPVIKNVMETGPAKKADVQVGDKVIKVDAKSTKGWNIKQVVQNLKGASGTQVALTIERKGVSKPIEKFIIRKTVLASSFGLRSLIHRYKGNEEESFMDATKAYSLDLNNAWAIVSLGTSCLDRGKYDESVKLLSRMKKSSPARILEATAYAKKGDFKRAVDIYSSIPEEKLSQKNVPLWSDRTALLDTLKPFISSKMESAGRLKAQGALNELGDALKVADDKTSKEICGLIYRIISMDPRLSVLPEEARKYALRGDMMAKEGNFEEAVKQYRKAVQAAPYIAKLYLNTATFYGELKKYPQAIRNMKTYLNLAPEATQVRAANDQIYEWEFMMEKGE